MLERCKGDKTVVSGATADPGRRKARGSICMAARLECHVLGGEAFGERCGGCACLRSMWCWQPGEHAVGLGRDVSDCRPARSECVACDLVCRMVGEQCGYGKAGVRGLAHRRSRTASSAWRTSTSSIGTPVGSNSGP